MDTDDEISLKEPLLSSDVTDYFDQKNIKQEPMEGLPWWKLCTNLRNKTVLLIVCCLFAVFASVEMGGALMAKSLALFGDATASCVDVITYFTNWYAETLATPTEHAASAADGGKLLDSSTPANITSSTDQIGLNTQTRLLHEVYVPVFSVIALVGVTIFILILASFEIASGGDDVTSANIMFAFASVNAVLDLACIAMFYFRKQDILFHRFPSFTADSDPVPHITSLTPPLRNVNINMFSALTHIGSDTLRTAAIFLAAIVSSTTGMKSSLCDAWAAVLVSVTIFIAIAPLGKEVFAAYTGER